LRAPTKRTATQRIKDLVLRQAPLPQANAAAADSMALVHEALLLRINNMPSHAAQHLQDSIRYTLRHLAIMPGGILVYPNAKSGFATAFVKFDSFEDFNSGMAQVLRLGMNAQESTVDELAGFHVLDSVNAAAKSLADAQAATRGTQRPPLTRRGSLQGTRLDSAGRLCTPRAPRVRATPVSGARVPELAAIGEPIGYTAARPWTAPTLISDAPLQISLPQQEQPRPGTMHALQRAKLRQEKSSYGKHMA